MTAKLVAIACGPDYVSFRPAEGTQSAEYYDLCKAICDAAIAADPYTVCAAGAWGKEVKIAVCADFSDCTRNGPIHRKRQREVTNAAYRVLREFAGVQS